LAEEYRAPKKKIYIFVVFSSSLLSLCVGSIEYVLGLFDEDTSTARRRYREFVRKGIEQGKRSELIGGGLIRSQGGWAAVKALRKTGAYQKGDERILGGSTFVEEVLFQANERMEQKYRLAAEGFDLERVARRVAKLMDISPEEVMDSGKGRRSVRQQTS